jgi:hypothetical protein
MNLTEAVLIFSNFHRSHPETKTMSPEQVNQFVLTLPEDECERIQNAERVIASEVRQAVEILMGRK